MTTSLVIIVLVLVVCVGALFRKVAKLDKPLSDSEAWVRNQTLKRQIKDELKKEMKIEEEITQEEQEDGSPQAEEEEMPPEPELTTEEKENLMALPEEEISEPPAIQPLPFEISFERVPVREGDETETCYFYDAGDSFIKTSEQIECIPESGEYEEFPKSVWPLEHIVSIYTSEEEGWTQTNAE